MPAKDRHRLSESKSSCWSILKCTPTPPVRRCYMCYLQSQSPVARHGPISLDMALMSLCTLYSSSATPRRPLTAPCLQVGEGWLCLLALSPPSSSRHQQPESDPTPVKNVSSRVKKPLSVSFTCDFLTC